MLVSLATLKLALGVEDTSEDDQLTLFESQAAAYVEHQTSRRFQDPDEVIEVLEGSGTRTLYLNGHIDDPDTIADDVTVRERIFRETWDTLDSDEFEVRGDALVRTDGLVWSSYAEYEVTYDSGYEDVPADIQALVIELVGILRASSVSSSSVTAGSAGIVEEDFGDYRYKVDASAAASAASAASTLSDNGLSILQNWTRLRA